MSNISIDIKVLANRISGHISEVQKAHRELDRIGRVFRSTWSTSLTSLLTKASMNPTDLTEEEALSLQNYRGSGRTALQWATAGTALYRLHTILEPQEPDGDTYNPSLNASDIAVLSIEWISGGNESTEPINVDIYKLLIDISRLVFEIEYDVEIYEAKVKSHIDSLADDGTEDGFTNRNKLVWNNAINALKEVVKVIFGELTSVSNDQGKYLNAF